MRTGSVQLRNVMKCAGFAALLVAGVLRAESGPSSGFGPDGFSANSTDDVGQYLGPIYKNELAGFQIAPPVGSRIINRAGLELVSFVHDAKQWGGSVQMANLVKTTNLAPFGEDRIPSDAARPSSPVRRNIFIGEYLKDVGTELTKHFRAVQVLNTRELKFQGHDAGRIETSMEAELGNAPGAKNGGGEIVALFQQQLIVKMGDADFMVLTLYTPLKDRNDAATTFEAMLTSFQLMDRTEIAKRLQLSVKAGKDWLAQRTADELKAKLSNQPQLFRMKVGGADVGYLRFDEQEDKRNRIAGVTVSINTRSFPQDGSIIYGQNIAFWGYAADAAADKRPFYSMWDNTTKTVTNHPNVPRAAQTYWIREFGTLQLEGLSPYSNEDLEAMRKHREEMLEQNAPPDKIPPAIVLPPKQYRLQVTYEGDASQPAIRGVDVPIAIERPAPLPSVLEYLWPRVVDLTKPSEMTFVVYNSGLRKLTYRKLSVIGPDHIVIDKKPIDCIRCVDEMEPNSTTLWVDSQGKILMMRTSDQSLLVPTTEDEMARLWAGKLRQQ